MVNNTKTYITIETIESGGVLIQRFLVENLCISQTAIRDHIIGFDGSIDSCLLGTSLVITADILNCKDNLNEA